MKKYNKISLALVVSGFSSFVSAVDLGEFNGTAVNIGGYIKAEGIFNNPDDSDSTFDGTARQSRINFSATKDIEGHQVKGFVEGDFWGASSNGQKTLRLRHAYVSVDNLTFGQTWNGQFLAVAPFDGEMINFFGPGIGSIAGDGGTVRPDLVIHYTKNGFRFTAQDPINEDADLPDLVASYTQRFGNGNGYNVAVTGRDASLEDGTDDSDFAAGISLAGKMMLGKNDIRANVYTGKGMGAYSGVDVAGFGGALDAENGDLVSQTGFSVAYRQMFTEKLRGTVRYGQVTVDDLADTKMEMTNINLIYTWLPNLDVGIEWRDQSLANHPTRPAGQQVELMAMYKF